ncbi:hypothetical protein C8Q80DRAFT_1222163 [Daedaleopsis nitida]|nr:hypothetical protein C8Q80DRAFT_1222163 [Daedaleopsis nitida]
MAELPVEILSMIASYLAPPDLLPLARTSRACQRAAESRLYESVVFRDASAAFFGCHTLTVRRAFRAPYVRRFILYQDPRRLHPRMSLAAVPPQFWTTLQAALRVMVNLDYMVFHDPDVAHAWILPTRPAIDEEDGEALFQLSEANVRLPWDAALVAFLADQRALRVLVLGSDADLRGSDSGDGPLCPLPPRALPALEVFSGPLLVVAELLGCPLTRLQIAIDQDTAALLPTVLAELARTVPTLRKLHIVGVPETVSLETLEIAARGVFAPGLRTLGVLQISFHDLPAVHRVLMKLPALEMIELDVSRWDPHPHETFQRMIALDLRIYCPTLRQAVFWLGNHRFLWWARDGEGRDWAFVHQPGRAPVHDNMWRS